MTLLYRALTQKARDDLSEGRVIALQNAAFGIEADPARPDDESAMQKNLRVHDTFTRDIIRRTMHPLSLRESVPGA